MLAVPEAWDWQGPRQLEGLRIATSYPSILANWLDEQGVSASVVERTRWAAASMRCWLTQACGVRPMEALNAREKWNWLRSATAEISARLRSSSR